MLTRQVFRWSVLALLAASVNLQAQESAERMTAAAEKFLATLKPEQKVKALLAADDKERFNWHFIPLEDKGVRKSTRKGLALEAMSEEQQAAALDLVKTGSSPSGYKSIREIMDREAMLHKLEMGKNWTRRVDWYFVTIFGEPGKKGKWSWRFEGHHLCLNYALEDGKLIGATPCFFGVNPAEAKDSALKGDRPLAATEDLARTLYLKLDDAQKTAAKKMDFPDIEGAALKTPVKEPIGVAVSQFNDEQKKLLVRLIANYLERQPADIALTQIKQIQDAGFDKITFAYSGEPESGKPHAYVIYGPTFVIQYENEQTDPENNPANHIHSVYRNLKSDFGGAEK
jgi:hypothetical protein